MRNRLRGMLFGDPTPAVRIGRYVVLEKIGSGGLGVVWSAYDPELDRRVALKLINPERVTPSAATRMQREAQAMARLSHPNVVTVHDVGPHGDGVFIAMELVDGMTLGRWIQEASPSWRRIRDVLVEAGQGLLAAHEQGLVHRDFKPANVLIDRRGRARVLDFGLARAAYERDSAAHPAASSVLDVELTQSGTTLGTPAYMAPEQFDGHADARSDQWSFCITAYEALFGHRPFAGSSHEELRQAVRAQALPTVPPTAVPAWLFRAIRKGLAVDPDGRHPSMVELLAAMEHDKHSRRKQWLALVGAVVLSLATAGITAAVLQPEPSAEAQALVERLEREARASASAGRYVYPPAETPDAATALGSIIALEHLDGPIARDAQARAEVLRRQFAEALVELGDLYWAREGGRPFAADYYGAALVFAPDHPRARERSTLTPGELATLRERAIARDFSPAELAGVEPLAVLTEPDEAIRARKVAALLTDAASPALSTSVHLERLLRADGDVRHVAPDSEHGGEEETSGEPKAVAPPKETKATKVDDQGRRARDPAAARAQIEAARTALARGQTTAAEQAFHRALDHDSGSEPALAGLSDLYFERGAYQKALAYAKKAVAAAPKKADLRMQLGDVLFKVHRYADARREYEVARSLGHPSAQGALDRLERRLGSERNE